MFSMPFTTVSSTCRVEAEAEVADTETQTGELLCIFATHTVNHRSSPFPPHLDLARFNAPAELAEGGFRFAHVVEHHEALPGDIPAAQDPLDVVAQWRRIRHILVVLRDLPTQDHVTAAVHLEARTRRTRTRRNKGWRSACVRGTTLRSKTLNLHLRLY